MENLNLSEEQSTAETITEYASLLWRWAWLLVLLAALAAGITYEVSRRSAPVYEASTLILINSAPGVQADAYSSIYLTQQLTTTYAQTMVTQPMLDAVVKITGLESLQPSSIKVQPVANTSLIRIVVQGADPEKAALTANTMFRVFSDQLQVDQSTRYADSKINLENQIAAVNKQIQDITDALTTTNQKIQDAQVSSDLLTQKIQDTTDSLETVNKKILDAQIGAYQVYQGTITLQSELEATRLEDSNQLAQLQSNILQYQPQQAQLQNSLSQYQNSYFSLMQSYEQIKLAEAQSSSLVIQKEPALPPKNPIEPQPVRNALLAALIGMMIAAGMIYLLEFMDDSLRDPQEITRKWGIPILGMIINFNSNNGNELITEKQPRAPVSEAFRSLRTNLQFASITSPIHTLVVTSPSPEDGKTTIVGNLASVFAQGGRKVVVVDSDLRRPRLHKVFQLPNRFGLTDQFIRPQEFLDGAVQPTEVKNLFMLSSGSLPPNPSELIGSQRMVEIIQALEAEYEMVILDTPPSLVVTDANVMANRADGVLLVISPAKTKRVAIKHTIEQLRQVKANIVGVVVNGVDARNSRYGYYRGYYHKYGHGYAYYSDAGNEGSRKRTSRKSGHRESVAASIKGKSKSSEGSGESGLLSWIGSSESQKPNGPDDVLKPVSKDPLRDRDNNL
jgi:polysaccharide biosynthesis transport protein